MADLLCRKAAGGVQVRIMITGKHLDRRFEWYAASKVFKRLLSAGVEIFRYEKTMMHLKVILADDELSLIGSANFNQRSQRKDAEVVLVVFSRERAKELRGHYEEDLAHARHEHEARWAHRSLWHRATERVVRVFRRQLQLRAVSPERLPRAPMGRRIPSSASIKSRENVLQFARQPGPKSLVIPCDPYRQKMGKIINI